MAKIKDLIFRGLQLILAIVVLSACSLIDENIEEQDLVGVWIEDRENCENELPACARLEFMENGRFSATNIPYDYFGYFPISSNVRFDASGEWKIEISSDPLGHDKIELLVDSVSYRSYLSYYDTLYIEGRKWNFNLYAWHGDPSNRINFVKLPEEDEAD